MDYKFIIVCGFLTAIFLIGVYLKWFRKKKEFITADCGHETKEEDKVSAFGEDILTKLPIENGKTSYCHKCIEKMVRQCAWCKRPIFIGDYLTLYTPAKKDFVIPEYAVVYSKDPLQLVGCQRTDCAETGADYCGEWLPPGEVRRFTSTLERSIQDLKSG